MAKETAIDQLFIGSDQQYVFTILDKPETTAIDITAFALSWMVKRSLDDPDDKALITKTTVSGIAISGSFNADPDVNTQVATVTVEDDDTANLQPWGYRYELKRTDAGFETPLAFGALTLVRGVHRT